MRERAWVRGVPGKGEVLPTSGARPFTKTLQQLMGASSGVRSIWAMAPAGQVTCCKRWACPAEICQLAARQQRQSSCQAPLITILRHGPCTP